MALEVKLTDNSAAAKEALNQVAIAWLNTWAPEIASQANRNCKMDGDEGKQLRGSYRFEVDESALEGTVGTPFESGYWEEFGTGSHAVDTSKSRPGWWVYTPDNPGPTGYKSMTYRDEGEAVAMAGYIEAKYGHKAVATNGREPQHTLENASKVTKPKADADLKERLQEQFGGDST